MTSQLSQNTFPILSLISHPHVHVCTLYVHVMYMYMYNVHATSTVSWTQQQVPVWLVVQQHVQDTSMWNLSHVTSHVVIKYLIGVFVFQQ